MSVWPKKKWKTRIDSIQNRLKKIVFWSLLSFFHHCQPIKRILTENDRRFWHIFVSQMLRSNFLNRLLLTTLNLNFLFRNFCFFFAKILNTSTSWIVASLPMTAAFTSLTIFKLVHKIGTRTLLLLSTITMALSWQLILLQ